MKEHKGVKRVRRMNALRVRPQNIQHTRRSTCFSRRACASQHSSQGRKFGFKVNVRKGSENESPLVAGASLCPSKHSKKRK